MIAETGYEIIEGFLAPSEVDRLAASLAVAVGRSGTRNVLDDPALLDFALSRRALDLAASYVGPSAHPVRGLLFDKTPDTNWRVTWHQDLTIAVRERREVPGFGPWSIKEGVPHVQPPAEVLEQMVALRFHLDDCGAENGPVRVLPGSHRAGKLEERQYDGWRDRVPAIPCLVGVGGVLAMRPLLLHASSPATRPGHRRVLHIEYAGVDLPGGLEWYWSPASVSR
jgi:hypothetical protein